MKVKVNQLEEEVNEQNAHLILQQQLKTEKDKLHTLVKKQRESIMANRISVGSQTEQVDNYLAMCGYIINK